MNLIKIFLERWYLEMTENRAVLKIIADKDRIYNDLDRTYKQLGAKHIVLVNKFVDLKILYGNVKAENKEWKRLLGEAEERIELLKGLRKE